MKAAILPLICLLLGTTIGWLSEPNSSAASPLPEPSRLSPRQARERSRTLAQAVPPDVAARLAPIQAARNPEERLRAVIHLARTLPVSELPRWFDAKWLTLQDGGDLNVFYEITRNRWLAEDPNGIMDRALLKNWDNLHMLADRLARTDPDAALTYLQSIQNPEDRQRVQQSMVGALAISHPADVLGLMHAFADPSQGSYQWSGALKSLAQHHPGFLESAELPSMLRETARAMLAQTRLEKDFRAELTNLISSPTGLGDFQAALNDYEAAGKFSKNLLAHIEQLPADWLNSLAGQSHSLTRNDAEAWLKLDLQALGMTESNANNFRNTAWQLLAQKKPAKVLENFAGLDSASDPHFGSYLTIALRTLNRTSPQEAAQWLAHYESQADDESFKQQLRQAMASDTESSQKPSAETLLEKFQLSQTGETDLSSLSYQLSSAPTEVQLEFANHIRAIEPEALSKIGYASGIDSVNRLPMTLQANLISSMIEHPPAEVTPSQQADLLRSTSSLATRWVQEDASAAAGWVSRLPAGETRQWALRNLAANWIPYDTPGAKAWIDRLPAVDRSDIQEFLEQGVGDR